jgi:hypothetical protein
MLLLYFCLYAAILKEATPIQPGRGKYDVKSYCSQTGSAVSPKVHIKIMKDYL